MTPEEEFEAGYRRWRRQVAWIMTGALVLAVLIVLWRFGS
jgi:hypothetical protein